MIFIKSLYKKFKHKDILTDCSFSLSSKGLYILTGDNGIGKTTLLNILSLNDSNYSGEIFFDEEKVDFSNSKLINKLKNNIEYLDQKNNFISYLDYLENYNLDTYLFKDTINSDISIKSQSLSDGEKIILLIDRCILRNKPIVLIDEVTSFLDDKNFILVMKKIEELSKKSLVIFATHDSRVDLSKYQEIALFDKKINKINNVINEEKLSFEYKIKKKKAPFALFFKYFKKNLLSNFVYFIFGLLVTLWCVNGTRYYIDNSTINLNTLVDDLTFKFTTKINEFTFEGKETFYEYNSILKNLSDNATYFIDQIKIDNNVDDGFFHNDKSIKTILPINNSYYAIISTSTDENLTDTYIHANEKFLTNFYRNYPYINYSTYFEGDYGRINKSNLFSDEFTYVFLTPKQFLNKYDLSNEISISDEEIIFSSLNEKSSLDKVSFLSFKEIDLIGEGNNYQDIAELIGNDLKVIKPSEDTIQLAKNEIIISENNFNKLVSARNYINDFIYVVDDKNKEEVISLIKSNEFSLSMSRSSLKLTIEEAEKKESYINTYRNFHVQISSLYFLILSYILLILILAIYGFSKSNVNRKDFNILRRSFYKSKMEEIFILSENLLIEFVSLILTFIISPFIPSISLYVETPHGDFGLIFVCSLLIIIILVNVIYLGLYKLFAYMNRKLEK